MIEDRITWRGRESVSAVEAALRQWGRADILLSPDYHHVLWRSLGEGRPGMPELLDVAGGAELLERIAAIGGLAEIALLAPFVAGAKAEVRVLSPRPVIHIMMPNAPRIPKLPRDDPASSLRDRS